MSEPTVYFAIAALSFAVSYLAWQIGVLNGRLDVHRQWMREHRDYHYDKFGEYPE